MSTYGSPHCTQFKVFPLSLRDKLPWRQAHMLLMHYLQLLFFRSAAALFSAQDRAVGMSAYQWSAFSAHEPVNDSDAQKNQTPVWAHTTNLMMILMQDDTTFLYNARPVWSCQRCWLYSGSRISIYYSLLNYFPPKLHSMHMIWINPKKPAVSYLIRQIK